jgi:nucleoside-triphosphatase THEP1
MIADMPDLKTAVKNPVSILNRMITRVERRLNEVRDDQQGVKKVFIVTGTIGEGKTAWLAKLTGLLKEKGVRVGGILALRIVEDGRTTGYDVSDISSGVRTPFLRHTGSETMGVERFSVNDAGYIAGNRALDPEASRDKDVVIVDEVGPLELRGRGWSGRVGELLQGPRVILIIAVRISLREAVIQKFGITEVRIIEVGNGDAFEFAAEIAALTVKS